MFSQKQIICTLFDHRYMSRGLCMISSLRRNGSNHEVWVLCLSSQARHAMEALALPGVRMIELSDLENHIPALLTARANRPLLEYYFTCMAALHRYLFDVVPQAECTMYVDADIQFFANPDIVFDAIGDAPAAITPHNFIERDRARLERYGIYNAGWTSFRRTPEGEKVLNWWLERSIEWCFDRFDGDRYANQGYLNHFKEIAPDTKILRQKGFNCGPWNLGQYRVSLRGSTIYLDEDPLVFFHFHAVRNVWRYFYFNGHRNYRAPLTRLTRNRLYRPYVAELIANEAIVSAHLPKSNAPLKVGRDRVKARVPLSWKRIKEILTPARHAARRIADVLSGRTIFVFGRQVW